MEIALGPERCRFTSFKRWNETANTVLGKLPYRVRHDTICVDAKGRICHIGRDFQRARDEKTFPVVAYAIRQDVE